MRSFAVDVDGLKHRVEAEKFEVEDGVLVFYKAPDGNNLGAMSNRRFRAFKNWNRVREV